MKPVITYLRHNALAAVALFVALGGTSYAAVAIPQDSVGTRQLRRGAVSSSKIHSGAITPGKLAGGAFGGRIADLVEIENDGSVALSDPEGIRTEDWDPNTGGLVIFPSAISKSCVALAAGASPSSETTGGPPTAGAAIQNSKLVAVAVDGPVPVTLAIICVR